MSATGTKESLIENPECQASSPVCQVDKKIGQLRRNTGRLNVLFVKIEEFGRLCATRSSVNGTQIFKANYERFVKLLPEHAQIIPLPRTGLVVLLDEGCQTTVEETAQQLVSASENPFSIDDHSVSVSVRVGIARDSDAEEEINLLDRAQFAQQNIEQDSDRPYRFYDSAHAERISAEVSLKNDLYSALDQDEFFLCYQPVVDLRDYTVEGAEALIRWRHPERGIVSPGEFIPLAEKTGQILFLDRWVLKTAVKQSAKWHQDHGWELPVGVNLSAWQFRDNFLVDKVAEILNETELPPSLLKLEVTETAVMKDVERAGEVLRELKKLGVTISLDDFGTGHATFEYLSQFPIDELKIDRTFLDFDDVYAKNRKLVDIMIETGKRIGTNILAEGIETQEQLEFLRNRGCETAQGFIFSRPLPRSDFRTVVEREEPLYDSAQ
jgi:EAL domain-containing protein (putative c-di-GMP-specific phosphodiesterase class I)/GGDEF domain-containing protein